nr:MAG: major capsid protein [Microvirus sp.]
MNPIFNSLPNKREKYNKFPLSHERKLSFNMGDLVPIMLQEVMPADKFKCNTDVFVRLAPMLAPIMHRVNLYVHYFYVPSRLLYADWNDAITGGKDGKFEPGFPYLQVQAGTPPDFTRKGTLWDYFGLPTTPDTIYRDLSVSAMPFRAYYLIWREFYRDQNLNNDDDFVTTGGPVEPPEVGQITDLRKRCWEKDYFTSCLPTAQRGDSVRIPYGSDDPIADHIIDRLSGNPVTGALSAANGDLVANGEDVYIDPQNMATINDFRRAEKLQQWLEKAMRGGGRYKEFLWNFFNVNSSDARLQRPEYLGGGKQGIIISEVLANAYSVDADANIVPQGNQSGHGISAGTGHGFKRFFEEHGYVIGIMSVVPRTAYQQGVHRMWQRFDKMDYPWPQFAHIGEQEVMSDELVISWGNAETNKTFGYQSRYAEMKFQGDTVHGDFRDNLDFYHMGRKWTSPPTLNESFVTADPTHRIFAVTDPEVHKLYAQVYHNLSVLRKLPYFGTPSI